MLACDLIHSLKNSEYAELVLFISTLNSSQCHDILTFFSQDLHHLQNQPNNNPFAKEKNDAKFIAAISVWHNKSVILKS